MVKGAYIRAKDGESGEQPPSNACPDRICVPAQVSVNSQKINNRSRNDYELLNESDNSIIRCRRTRDASIYSKRWRLTVFTV